MIKFKSKRNPKILIQGPMINYLMEQMKSLTYNTITNKWAQSNTSARFKKPNSS